MRPGTLSKKECEERLRRLVGAQETIVAVGTAEELPSLGPDIGSGGGFTFLVVTAERLLFAGWDSPQERHEEIRLCDVRHWVSGTQYNCLVMVLTHPPMRRRQWVPAHRIGWFRWGNSETEVNRTQTIFRFSRPDTQVAKVIRAALTARNVPFALLNLEEKSRKDRTRGSHAVLRPKK